MDIQKKAKIKNSYSNSYSLIFILIFITNIKLNVQAYDIIVRNNTDYHLMLVSKNQLKKIRALPIAPHKRIKRKGYHSNCWSKIFL